MQETGVHNASVHHYLGLPPEDNGVHNARCTTIFTSRHKIMVCTLHGATLSSPPAARYWRTQCTVHHYLCTRHNPIFCSPTRLIAPSDSTAPPWRCVIAPSDSTEPPWRCVIAPSYSTASLWRWVITRLQTAFAWMSILQCRYLT